VKAREMFDSGVQPGADRHGTVPVKVLRTFYRPRGAVEVDGRGRSGLSSPVLHRGVSGLVRWVGRQSGAWRRASESLDACVLARCTDRSGRHRRSGQSTGRSRLITDVTTLGARVSTGLMCVVPAIRAPRSLHAEEYSRPPKLSDAAAKGPWVRPGPKEDRDDD
jgi:hypothetical protein